MKEYEQIYNIKSQQDNTSNFEVTSLDNNYGQEDDQQILKPFSMIENWGPNNFSDFSPDFQLHTSPFEENLMDSGVRDIRLEDQIDGSQSRLNYQESVSISPTDQKVSWQKGNREESDEKVEESETFFFNSDLSYQNFNEVYLKNWMSLKR